MTMRELIKAIPNTPLLKVRFERFNQILQEKSGGANRRQGRVVHVEGTVGEGKVQTVPSRVR